MKLHCLKGYIQNIHLVEYPNGCMLLDGCCKVDYQLIVSFFETELKRPITDLKVVVVTHMHPDHAGCAKLLKKASNCKIVMGKANGHWYQGVKGRIAHLVDMGLALWVAGRMGKKRKNIWYHPVLRPDIVLDDKSSIPDFPDWQLIYTPGHTDRDISLVNSDKELLYLADLIVSVKKKLAPPFPVYLPKEYKQSLNRIKQYEGYTILMAHVAPQTLSTYDFDQLISIAPNTPQTNARSLSKKFARLYAQKQS